MAITIHKYPDPVSPAYNEAIYLVSSNNTGQPNFKYVFDIYATNGTTLLTRVKLPARPSDARCYFDAKRIIESLVTFDLPTIGSAAGFYLNPNSYYKYTLKIGEEYGATPTVYPNLQTASNLYIWNAALTHSDFSTYISFPFTWLTYTVASGTNPLFTGRPLSQNIETGQNAWLYMMTLTANAIANAVVKKYNSAGTLLGTLTIANAYAALASDGHRFVRFACGTANINAHTANWLNGASYYTVHIENSAATIVSKTYTFAITENCQYETVRLHWLNHLGGFDAFNFTMKSNERQNITRDSFRKKYGSTSGTTWSYTMAERGNTTFNTEVNKSFNINSDWLTEAESTWLSGLISSPEVYREVDGVLVAVDITNADYAPQKKVNNKLFNLNLSFKYSFNNTKQRG